MAESGRLVNTAVQPTRAAEWVMAKELEVLRVCGGVGGLCRQHLPVW